MRKLYYFAVAAATVLLGTAMALPASADTADVLTYGSAGGANVAVGDVVTASLASGTQSEFYSDTSDTSGIACNTSSFSGTVQTNPAASGVATESVTSQSFSNCSSNIGGVTGVQSVSVDNLPYNASVDDSAGTLTITGTAAAPIQSTVVVQTIFGPSTCVYQADNDTITGKVSNTDNSITFTNQKFDLTSGFLCLGNSYFSATYSPASDSTQGNAPVFVN